MESCAVLANESLCEEDAESVGNDENTIINLIHSVNTITMPRKNLIQNPIITVTPV